MSSKNVIFIAVVLVLAMAAFVILRPDREKQVRKQLFVLHPENKPIHPSRTAG
jgi:preprotein translocase subunit YajC